MILSLQNRKIGVFHKRMNSKVKKLEQIITKINTKNKKKSKITKSTINQSNGHSRQLTQIQNTITFSPYFVNSSKQMFTRTNSFNRYNTSLSKSKQINRKHKHIPPQLSQRIRPWTPQKITLFPTAITKPICNREQQFAMTLRFTQEQKQVNLSRKVLKTQKTFRKIIKSTTQFLPGDQPVGPWI